MCCRPGIGTVNGLVRHPRVSLQAVVSAGDSKDREHFRRT